MADQQSASGDAGGQELLTLTEVSNRTGISMPTLQRYKKEFQDRIPTVGEGRTQKYPVESLPVFEQIKKENIKKRGRPRKKSKGGGKKKAASEPARSDLLTLTEIGERTGISYPTLVRYVKLHGDEIPYEGKGRKKRYHPEAVEVFNRLRSESGRGRKSKSKPKASGGKASSAATGSGSGRATDPALGRRVAALEKSQERLEKQIRSLLDELKKPLTVTLKRGK